MKEKKLSDKYGSHPKEIKYMQMEWIFGGRGRLAILNLNTHS
jgi:hypothetical protein